VNRQDHWDKVYAGKSPESVSWYQARPAVSLELVAAAGIRPADDVLDVGGGASTFVDCLLDAGFSAVTVLDLSAEALARAQARLGTRAGQVQWIHEDVTLFRPPTRFALWHDRAVFHFLVEAADRTAYVDSLRRCLEPGGTAIIATFAPEGPEKCSGLPVMRYDEDSLQRELGTEFELQEARRESHLTPWRSEQRFLYARFRRLRGPAGAAG
jgi:trans-aconitate methyltransferase